MCMHITQSSPYISPDYVTVRKSWTQMNYAQHNANIHGANVAKLGTFTAEANSLAASIHCVSAKLYKKPAVGMHRVAAALRRKL